MRAWGRLLQLLGCWSVLGATQLLRSSGSRAPPSPGTSAERGRSPVHACVQVCATVGLGWQPGGHSSELWVLQRLEQDYDLARGRLGLCCECSGCQPLLCWGKITSPHSSKITCIAGERKVILCWSRLQKWLTLLLRSKKFERLNWMKKKKIWREREKNNGKSPGIEWSGKERYGKPPGVPVPSPLRSAV